MAGRFDTMREDAIEREIERERLRQYELYGEKPKNKLKNEKVRLSDDGELLYEDDETPSRRKASLN